jgi:biotin carboxyl carrier protein
VRELVVRTDDRTVLCVVDRDRGEFVVRVGDVEHRLRLLPDAPGVFVMTTGGRSQIVRVATQDGRWFLHLNGVTVQYEITPAGPPADARDAAHRPLRDDLSAPMPGAVTQVLVREGEVVRLGQPIVIVEAMKMEHVIRAPRPGTVLAVRVRAGDQVEGGTVVAELAPASSASSAEGSTR